MNKYIMMVALVGLVGCQPTVTAEDPTVSGDCDSLKIYRWGEFVKRGQLVEHPADMTDEEATIGRGDFEHFSNARYRVDGRVLHVNTNAMHSVFLLPDEDFHHFEGYFFCDGRKTK